MINKKFSPSQPNFTAIWSQNSTFAMMTSQRSSSVVVVLVLCGMLCCSSVGIVQAQSEYVNIPLDGSNVTGHVVFMGEPWVSTFTPTTYGAVSHPHPRCHTPHLHKHHTPLQASKLPVCSPYLLPVSLILQITVPPYIIGDPADTIVRVRVHSQQHSCRTPLLGSHSCMLHPSTHQLYIGLDYKPNGQQYDWTGHAVGTGTYEFWYAAHVNVVFPGVTYYVSVIDDIINPATFTFNVMFEPVSAPNIIDLQVLRLPSCSTVGVVDGDEGYNNRSPSFHLRACMLQVQIGAQPYPGKVNRAQYDYYTVTPKKDGNLNCTVQFYEGMVVGEWRGCSRVRVCGAKLTPPAVSNQVAAP